jgi:hypothetical protein
VRDLRDPKNPYKGKYAAYDLWIFAYAWNQAQATEVRNSDEQQAGHWYSMAIDDKGWPVPQNLDQQHQYEKGAGGCSRSISAYGFMGEQLEVMQQRDLLKVEAEHLPDIPQWLAEAPPSRAMLLPNGEVVTLGGIGEPPAAMLDPMVYYRYSAEGKERSRTAHPSWWTLYWPDYPALHDQHADDVWSEYSGYIARYDKDTGKCTAIYDYTGKRIRGTPPQSDARYFRWLSGESLTDLYRLQQNQAPLSDKAIDS